LDNLDHRFERHDELLDSKYIGEPSVSAKPTCIHVLVVEMNTDPLLY
jgi:hypothetical protein